MKTKKILIIFLLSFSVLLINNNISNSKTFLDNIFKKKKTSAVKYPKKQTITVIGSDTMVIIGYTWTEVYMKENKGKVSIQVTGGGSGVGIASLMNGTADLANASRPMKAKEKKKFKEKGFKLIEFKVALDAISIYINETNPVKELSFKQLAGIYTGKIKNWKKLGGNNAPIITYGRENSSGTYGYLKKHVLKRKDFANTVQLLPGTSAIVNAVLKDKNGIGYGGKAYIKGIKAVKIKKGDKDTAYAPSDKNIDKYPLTRLLFIYTLEKNIINKPFIKDYINWILDKNKGQKIVKDVGYYPIN